MGLRPEQGLPAAGYGNYSRRTLRIDVPPNPHPMKPLRILPLVLLPLLPACRGAEAPGDAATVRDSAGIQIVQNQSGQWKEGEGWRLSDEPTLRIGVAEGEAAYQLDRVRTALRLGDGRIALANAGSQEIRLYDAAGTHLGSSGGQGGGPGEFQSLGALLRLPGDSLLAYDPSGFRLSWMDPSGRFVRSVQLQPLGEVPPRFVDRFADGSMLLSRSTRSFGADIPDGIRRDTLQWLRMAPGGAMDSLPVTPGGESHFAIHRSGGQITGMNVMTLPFMRNVQTAAAGDGYWQGTNDSYEVVLRGMDGTARRIVRRSVQPVPVKGAYLDSLRSVQAAEMGDAAMKGLDQVPVPESLPAFERLLVDDTGHLWVLQTTWPGHVQPAWDVFDAEGRMLGTVRLPARFRATHVGGDFILGVGRDENDVEQVRMYRLVK